MKKKSFYCFVAVILMLCVFLFFFLVPIFPNVQQRWICLPLFLLAALVIELKRRRDKV